MKLYHCPHNCGRKFNKKALNIHKKNCKKVFINKKKVFDSF